MFEEKSEAVEASAVVLPDPAPPAAPQIDAHALAALSPEGDAFRGTLLERCRAAVRIFALAA